MSTSWSTGIHGLGTALVAAAAAYACAALLAVVKGLRALPEPASRGAAGALPPVTVLKPLHGADARLYDNLRGFFEQAYPAYQLVFGVREAGDPAVAVVQRLRAEFPGQAAALVIDPRMHGTNPKVSNLINTLPHAAHDWLVLADSDISVRADYLARVTAPLADPGVGIVTCLYHGVAQPGLWPRVGRLFIDDWFAPSVRLAHALGSTRFAFGSTIAVRRDALRAVGGLEILRDTLADDFWLGELTRRAGYRTVLSDLVVGTDVGETRLAALWMHEVRWLRTIRAVAPLGFAMTFVCFTSPMLVLGLCLAPTALNAGVFLLGACARVLLSWAPWRTGQAAVPRRDILLIPFRDSLLLLEWAAALTGWRVRWQGQVLHARRGDPHT